jgi:hypothetical protein
MRFSLTKYFLLFAIAILTSCSGNYLSQSIKPEDYSPDYGYIYGSFKIIGRFGGDLTLEIGSKTDSYYIPFSHQDKEETKIFKVKPGDYSITGLSYSFSDIGHVGKMNFKNSKVGKEFSIKPNQAYYLGNWLTLYTVRPLEDIAEWNIQEIKNNYSNDTGLIQNGYSSLSNITNINLISMNLGKDECGGENLYLSKYSIEKLDLSDKEKNEIQHNTIFARNLDDKKRPVGKMDQYIRGKDTIYIYTQWSNLQKKDYYLELTVYNTDNFNVYHNEFSFCPDDTSWNTWFYVSYFYRERNMKGKCRFEFKLNNYVIDEEYLEFQ